MRYDDAMRILLVTLLLGLAGVGCGGDDTTSMSSGGADLAMSMMVHDMAGVDMATAICGDLGSTAFGSACTTDCQCATGMCRMFQMGAVHLCTKPCTPATQATDCPAPSVGTCTNNGYCKF